MVGTIMEVMVILSCLPKLHLEQDDPYNLDQDSNLIQGCFKAWMPGEDDHDLHNGSYNVY